jgi:hypothetical protein
MKKLTLLTLLVASLLLVGCWNNNAPAADGTVPGTQPAGDTAQVDGEAPVAVDTEETTALAQCLTDNGVIMYGTEWCGHCKNQKALFGEAFATVTYVDCDAQRQTCLDAGVRGFPTWIDTAGNQYPGTQQLARLAEIGGCTM